MISRVATGIHNSGPRHINRMHHFSSRNHILAAAAYYFAVTGGGLSSKTGTACCAFSSNNNSATTPATASSMTYIDKLALVLVRDRKQLVARSKGKTAFFTPGGKRELGESDEEALCRECREELTIELDTSTIAPYGVFEAQAFGKPEGTMVRMTCYSADSYQGTLTPNEEIEELRWITSTCPHEDLTVTGIMILQDLKAKNLID
eukprot:scaffold39860_cov57-Attheya_sp.AAC.9